MKINVGSKNRTKLTSVSDAVNLYPKLFPNPEIVGVDVEVELFGHPKDLKSTIEGAISRARQAFKDCDYSFGLESGLMEVPLSKTGFMEISACAIYDGKDLYTGLSPAFEWPKKVTDLILEGRADASQAFKQLGLTHHDKLGAVEGGIIGVLTDGKMTREDFMKYSILMALVRLEMPSFFAE